MSTIQALNKIKSFEIEYFSKYEENGAGIKIFDLLLLNPPSKTWDLLGKELILLLQYWLNALRKHLIIHNNNWWPFLQSILKFVKELGLKECKLNDVIVKETAECLLDLATHTRPDINQRYKILCALNACSIACSREIRVALRTHFEVYFIKLATLLSSCGDAAVQYSIMETLLRWLLPRYVQEVRRDAALKWFPTYLYDKETVTMFVERPWKDFFQDTRDFLNAHNARSDLITSVICKKLIIGQIVVITGSEKCYNWLDINTSTKCLTVMLEPRLLRTLGCGLHAEACEALVINEVNTDAAKLRKIAQEVTIFVKTLEPAHLIPSTISLSSENCKEIKIVVSTKCDMGKVDSALRRIFADKYQVLFDIENGIPISPQKNNTRQDTSEEDTTFSIPSVRPKRRTGYVVKSRTVASEILASSASTTSLAQLHEKLEELPYYEIKHDRMKIPYPGLSRITEASESDAGRSCGSSAFKLKSFGICQKSTFTQAEKSKTKEVKKTKLISPAITDEENSVSCLFVATIGSADESVINDTLERLPKNRNPENIIDVLVQEAFNANNVSCDKNNDNSDVPKEAGNTLNKPILKEITNENRANKRKSCTVISNSTSEEIVEGTQFSNTLFEKRNTKEFIMKESEIFPVKVSNDKVEEFFSQHFSNNPVTEVISPSIARKHNETESEPSEEDTRRKEDLKINDSDIDLDVELCLKFIIDTICNEFDRCEDLHETSIVDKHPNIQDSQEEIHEENTTKDTDDFKRRRFPTVKEAKSIKKITLKFKNPKKPNGKTQKKSKVKSNENSVMSKKVETAKNTKNISSVSDTSNNMDESIPKNKRTLRNKRKLYSPKDDEFNDKCDETENRSKVAQNTKTYNKTRTSITSYKEIEKERNEYRKKLRNKQSKENKLIFISPKTKKMNDIFDTLKSNIDTNQEVTLVNKTNTFGNVDVYNFSSDSEDNFKTSAVKHLSPKRSTLEKKSKQDKKKKTYSRKNAKSKPKLSIKIERPLIDERMREAPPETLDTSFELRRSPRNIAKEPIPNIETEHEMEVLQDVKTKHKANNKRVNTKLEKKKKSPLKNKKKNLNKITNYIKCNETFDTTVSPLPGLTVETIPNKNVANVSASPKRLEKIREMYAESPEKFENFNTTQNLLMDLDQTSECGVQEIEHCAEIHQNSQDNSQSSRILRSQKKQTPTKKVVVNKKNDLIKSIKKNKNKNKRRNEIDPTKYVIDISADSNSEISINTVGICPITAHGDFELCYKDLPPNQDILNKTIEPRNLEIEEQNESIKELYLQLQNERLEDQINQTWNRSFRNNIESVSTKKSTPLNITKISSDDYIKYLPSLRDSDTSSNHSVDELDKPRSYNSNKPVSRSKINSRISDNLNRNITLKSQISPIILFHDEQPNHNKSESNRSIDSDNIKQVRNLFYKTKLSNKSSTMKTRNSDINSSKRESLRDSVNKLVKRKSSELLEMNKKRKIESVLSNTPIHSSENISSSFVNNWFDQCIPSTSRDGRHNYDENVRCILEKLDTTLVEIHHNTDRRFIKTFVETQKRFSELKRVHHEVYEETLRDLNYKFKRLQEMSDEIFEEMKSRMRDVITQDRKQKIAMVKILKEDVQAVVDFNARRAKQNK
ncbi:hypothetical protein RR48_04699 [Papilio machaon]|uniref:Uncharacterized protein n=1 Tax=Papilio machaon TaxID=76193 RepID=A0A0N1ICI3_PAPMA|nr:hypothetical protein RR48_04699 [Papilio machaon]